jgi:beta-phosphoglucomutase-like phosphatase (HAD superfamily)
MIKITDDIKALIFDCDGTLVDSMPLHFKAWQETYEALGREYPHDFVDERKGMPIHEVVNQYNAVYNDNIDVQEFVNERERRVKVRLPNVKAIAPVVDVANKYNGILPMAICSGSMRESVNISIQAIGLAGVFKVILTSDDQFKPKPAPDMFLEAAKRLNINPRYCQVFEDGDLGIQAAKNAGMVATDIRKYI